MRKVSLIKPLFLLFAVFLSACTSDEGSGSGSVNVEGVWHSQVNVQTCSPTNVCDASGFQAGQTVNATMDLHQNGSHVEGKYTYENSGIEANVSGDVAGDQLLLNGSASNLFGNATVRIVGTVSGGTIRSQISHIVNLVDGRSGTISGSGDFTK